MPVLSLTGGEGGGEQWSFPSLGLSFLFSVPDSVTVGAMLDSEGVLFFLIGYVVIQKQLGLVLLSLPH